MCLLLDAKAPGEGVIVRSPKAFHPQPLALDAAQASDLWDRTASLSAERGLVLS